ncbi:DUF2291 domain-containing protein [Rouxiella silvae]|uniref:DUF2291 domain-containing protein n=1 Tax=Rouxiella silvae TaxID=1646373 RepID=A0AA40WYR2_9GAMM|nr:DUF2291 domain-containing protein [Rouxiella silvae]MBF6635319.1 DUF2291 domain-containing protein [Rouxiella silvae]
MTTVTPLSNQVTPRALKRVGIALLVALAVAAAIGLNTKVVKIGSAQDVAEQAFSPDKYGEKAFPEIQKNVEARAVDASTLATALAADANAAATKYGVGNPMPVFSITLTGVVGEGELGVYQLKVAGLPDDIRVRLQTGPAINGTDLRDATGTIQFGDFKNQIEYQNAGSGINRAMKKAVLGGIDNQHLTGKTVNVTGVFRLLNPKNWLVTPVRMTVQ